MVIGSRGHGRISGLSLGSTGDTLISRGHCPAVIVRADREH
jgi:nucleotide-binding universal stress UspA family protein